MSALEDLYQSVMLDHARAPRHGAIPVDATHGADGYNPMCGDRVQLGMKLDGQGLIEAIGVHVEGCSICVASGSIMAEVLLGKGPADAREAFARLQNDLDSQWAASADPQEDLLAAFAGVARYPSRLLCVKLPWQTMEKAWNTGPEAS